MRKHIKISEGQQKEQKVDRQRKEKHDFKQKQEKIDHNHLNYWY